VSAKLCGVEQRAHLCSAGRPSRWALAHILVVRVIVISLEHFLRTQHPSQRGTAPSNFRPICCGQMAAWTKMPLGMEMMEVGLGPSDIVLDGDPSSPPQKRRRSPPIFGPILLWPNGWMDQDGTWHGDGPRSTPHCARWDPATLPKRAQSPRPQFSAHFYCRQTAGCIKMPLGMEVGIGPDDIVLAPLP